MSTILGDKVVVSSEAGVFSLNNPTDMSAWPGALRMSVDEIDGWQKTFDLDVISVPRGVGDGNYTAARFPAKARFLSVAGYVGATSRAALDNLWDLINLDVLPVDQDITLTRYEPVPKYVVGRLSGPAEITQYLGREGWLRWEAPLLCSDPYKYDAVNSLSGISGIAGLSAGGRVYPRVYPLQYITVGSGTGNGVTVTNVGTAKTYPVFTIVGPINIGWRIENSPTGAEQSFDLSLSSGDVLVIDNQNKYATVNGSPVSGLLNGDWMSLAPGGNVVKLFADYNATATFSVAATSRWR